MKYILVLILLISFNMFAGVFVECSFNENINGEDKKISTLYFDSSDYKIDKRVISSNSFIYRIKGASTENFNGYKDPNTLFFEFRKNGKSNTDYKWKTYSELFPSELMKTNFWISNNKKVISKEHKVGDTSIYVECKKSGSKKVKLTSISTPKRTINQNSSVLRLIRGKESD